MNMKEKYSPPQINIPKIILNRRYKKLQELIENEEYFSEEQIRIRDPLLYFLYVGQYIRNGNQQPSQVILSEILIEQIQRQEYEIKLQEEYDKLNKQHDYPNILKETQIKDSDLQDQEDLLIRLMHDKFMNGQDFNFINYEQIDNNSQYDDIIQQMQDQEEEYFNQLSDKEEEEKENNVTEYTGIQDY